MNFLSTPRLLAIAAAVMAAIPSPGLLAQKSNPGKSTPEKSIVRVNATLQDYSFLRPWEKGAPTPRRGLGAVLEGNRVLITAEMCVNSTYLELEHPSSGARVTARIKGIDYEANLAVLEPADSDSKVFEGLEPLSLDDSVVAGDKLNVWQVEDNGDGVSTDVDVLRVDVGRYFIPGSIFLLYQVKGSLQARTSTPGRPPGAIQASADSSSAHRRTRSPRPARSAASRQHTPMSPWLSMTRQNKSHSRGGGRGGGRGAGPGGVAMRRS